MDRRRRISLAYRDAVLATNPVAYWRLGEASGTVAADEMGAHNGTYVGAPTLGVAGALAGDPDTAMRLTATTQYMEAPHNAALNITGDLTLAALVYLDSTPLTYSGLISKRTTNSGTPFVLMLYGNRLGLAYLNAAGTIWTDTLSAGPAVSNSAWHHVAATRVISTGAIVFYVDALPFPGFTGQTSAFSNTQNLRVGMNAGGSGIPGIIDEPAMWNRALTPAEIATLYAAGMGR